MKKVSIRMKRLLVSLVTGAMLISGTAAVASGNRTVEVSGKYYEKGTKQLSVSNVIKELNIDNINSNMSKIFGVSGAYEVESPSTVKIIADSNGTFDVYKLNRDSGGKYTYKYEDALPIVGEPDEYIGAYNPGSYITLTEPGEYYVSFRFPIMDGATEVFLKVNEKSVLANPTNSKILVNGGSKAFEAYNIDGNNYFKLRDLAKVINGTEKQFEVVWDQENLAINLISNKAYTSVGGELSEGDGKVKTPVLNKSKILKDGKEVELKAYNINGYNYFKLRDVASAFDIGVSWDGITNTVGINTAEGYTE